MGLHLTSTRRHLLQRLVLDWPSITMPEVGEWGVVVHDLIEHGLIESYPGRGETRIRATPTGMAYRPILERPPNADRS